MKKINYNTGFTLIELIAVIIILAILAATAIPKFINLGADARLKLVDTTYAMVLSATNLAYSKCIITPGCYQTWGLPLTGPDGLVGIMHNGYPTGLSRVPAYFGIKDWVTAAGGITVVELNDTEADFIVDSAPNPVNCKVRFREAASLGLAPTITKFTGGC